MSRARNPRCPDSARAQLARFALLLVGFAAFGCQADGDASTESGSAGDPADYPQGEIEVVSWATPGGPTDLLSRSLARVGARHFGAEMRVVTREGGSGAAAMRYLTSRPADGQTLAVFTSSGAINMATGRIPFGVDDFSYLLRVQLDPFLIAVRDESPFRTLGDLFAHARENPGELSIAGFGAASAHFLAFQRLTARAGDPDIRWIAYGGSGEAAVAALGGHTDVVHTNYNTIREHLRAGTMRVLGASAPVSTLPDVPTYRDQGYDVSPVHWRGVVAHGELPDPLADRVRSLLQATVEDPEFQEFMRTGATEDGRFETRAEFRSWVEEEVEADRELLRRLDLLDRGR